MTVYRAKYDSWGFLGKTWFEDDLTHDLTEEEANDPAIIHFEPVDAAEKPAPVDNRPEPSTLSQATAAWQASQEQQMAVGMGYGFKRQEDEPAELEKKPDEPVKQPAPVVQSNRPGRKPNK